jgi:hypothetical protein
MFQLSERQVMLGLLYLLLAVKLFFQFVELLVLNLLLLYLVLHLRHLLLHHHFQLN